MGNCCRRGSSLSVVWAGDDWGSVGEDKRSSGNSHHHAVLIERQRLLGEDMMSSSNNINTNSSTREVKIKITKRELEELMARVDMQGLSMEDVLVKLINSSSTTDHDKNLETDQYYFYHHHRSWKPALQSIPERVTRAYFGLGTIRLAQDTLAKQQEEIAKITREVDELAKRLEAKKRKHEDYKLFVHFAATNSYVKQCLDEASTIK